MNKRNIPLLIRNTNQFLEPGIRLESPSYPGNTVWWHQLRLRASSWPFLVATVSGASSSRSEAIRWEPQSRGSRFIAREPRVNLLAELRNDSPLDNTDFMKHPVL